ncbi:MAG TPA: hypothetical protein GX747_04170 [Tenericutes bacterium]|nr:hypothetical protein [Mycoplasmatota bacterium]
MKKNGLILIILCLMLTGCVKYEVGMTINRNKSINVELIYAMNGDLSSMANVNSIDETRKSLENNGFKVSEYKENNLVGISATKNLGHINELSGKNNISLELTSLLDDKFYGKEVFNVEEGFLKNMYKANFSFDMTNEDEQEDINEKSDYDYSKYLDVKFVLKSEFDIINHNADEVSKDGKTYTWNPKYGLVNDITFEFSAHTDNSIYLILLVSAVIIIIIIICIIKLTSRRIRKTKEIKKYNSAVEVLDFEI